MITKQQEQWKRNLNQFKKAKQKVILNNLREKLDKHHLHHYTLKQNKMNLAISTVVIIVIVWSIAIRLENKIDKIQEELEKLKSEQWKRNN